MAAGRWKFASSLLLAALAAGLMLHFRPRPPRPFDGAPPGVPAAALREGDLVFRRGHGLWSGLFAEASAHDRRFSHVGVLIRAGDAWQVVHASADDRTGIGGTEAEPLAAFLHDATDFEIRRPRLSTAQQVDDGGRQRLSVARLPNPMRKNAHRLNAQIQRDP